MLINHCHVSARGFGSEADDPTMGTLATLQRVLAEAGVDKAVAFAPFGWEGGRWEEIGGGLGRNEWLVGQLEDHPNLLGFANVFPQDHDAPDQLRRAIESGLVGAKVHPPVMRIRLDDPALEPFWTTAEELRIPVSIHTGVHGSRLRTYMPILLDDVAQRHPNLPLLLEHIGGIAFFDQALAVLHNNKNCYVGFTQLSGRDPKYALSPERLRLLLDTVGADRLVYGFDYPWNPGGNLAALKHDLAWIGGWDIPEADKAKILGGNLERLTSKEARTA